MQKFRIKYRFDKYGTWTPKNRKDSIEVELHIDEKKPVFDQVLKHCQKEIDSDIIQIMVL